MLKDKTVCIFLPENQKLENLFIRTQNYIYSDPVEVQNNIWIFITALICVFF